jgi:hypothetical protein
MWQTSLRNPLTGEPIDARYDPANPRYFVRYDAVDPRMSDPDFEPTPDDIAAAERHLAIPLTLHRSMPATADIAPELKKYRHGSPELSRAFLRYLDGQPAEEDRKEADKRIHWWQDEYVMRQLRRTGKVPAHVLDALDAWLNRGQDYHVITRRLRKGQGWLAGEKRKVAAIVQAHYYADTPPLPQPRIA